MYYVSLMYVLICHVVMYAYTVYNVYNVQYTRRQQHIRYSTEYGIALRCHMSHERAVGQLLRRDFASTRTLRFELYNFTGPDRIQKSAPSSPRMASKASTSMEVAPASHSPRRRCSTSTKRVDGTIDMIKILPSIVWLIVCIAALPYYAQMAWRTPIICAILSSGIALTSTYDIFRFHRRRKYFMFGTGTDPGSQMSRYAEIKLCTACAVTAICLGLTIAFLAVGYSLPEPKVTSDGCGYGNFRPPHPDYKESACGKCSDEGNCLTRVPDGCNHTCVEIRDMWAAQTIASHPEASSLCPPPPSTANTFVAFSCKADGFWMLVTCIVSFIWVMSLVVLRRRSVASGDMISIMTPFFGKSASAEVVDFNASEPADV